MPFRRTAALPLLIALAACGGGRQPESLPPQTMTRVEPENPESLPQQTGVEASGEAPAEEAPEDPGYVELVAESGDDVFETEDDTVVVIDHPAKGDQAPSLAEAARAERERRSREPAPTMVITDRNLSQWAVGDLTVAEPTTPGGEEGSEADEAAEARAGDEAEWRRRARAVRQAWADAADRIAQLEEEVAELRQRFYAEDDGYYRDSQIKPAWDRAIDRLASAKREVVERQEELATLMEEGRRAGALPGWLREGIELEPQPREEPDEIHEPGEPTVYVEEDGAR